MTVSEKIRQRLLESGDQFAANDNISAHIKDGELEALRGEVAEAVQSLLSAMVIDTENDHNSRDTANRVAKMYLTEVFKGRYLPKPSITDFPNAKGLDELYTVGPITVRSYCSHHLVPVVGRAWVGVIPSQRVIGLSKFNRLCDWIMSRPQIQEEATVQLADTIEELIEPIGLAVIVEAEHHCMKIRGVKEDNCKMKTSVMRGEFRDNPSAKHELMELLHDIR